MPAGGTGSNTKTRKGAGGSATSRPLTVPVSRACASPAPAAPPATAPRIPQPARGGSQEPDRPPPVSAIPTQPGAGSTSDGLHVRTAPGLPRQAACSSRARRAVRRAATLARPSPPASRSAPRAHGGSGRTDGPRRSCASLSERVFAARRELRRARRVLYPASAIAAGYAPHPVAQLALAELPLPARRAIDERLIVARQLEPQLRDVGGDPALLARHGEGCGRLVAVSGSDIPWIMPRLAGGKCPADQASFLAAAISWTSSAISRRAFSSPSIRSRISAIAPCVPLVVRSGFL